jgi:hypothetical protein
LTRPADGQAGVESRQEAGAPHRPLADLMPVEDWGLRSSAAETRRSVWAGGTENHVLPASDEPQAVLPGGS